MAKKIFIIEDEVNLLYGLEAKFRVEGFDVATDQGSDKESVLEKIKNIKPDYIILDIILPLFDGFELLSEIKQDPLIFRIPLFIFTNLSDQDSRRKGINSGADYYLIKSELNLDEFVEKFKKIIRNRAMARS